MDGTLAIIGTGRLGEALLRGLLSSGWITPSQVVATARREERCAELADAHGVKATTDNRAAIEVADVVLLALKPQAMLGVVGAVADAFHPEQTVISVAAGTPTSALQDATPEGIPIVRVMTNTPVQVDEAMSVVSGGTHAGERDLALAEEIFSHVGRVVRMPEEHLDSVTALSGSGPAYFFLLAEAMIDAGILLGLPRDVSSELIIQTMVGSAKMLRDTGRHPVELREMVTSPGGTTIAAIRQLEASRVRAAFLDAIEAAKLRGEQLARGE
ncbi:pyrroline-5-carboxylate reductase [Egicoccus halophilus]|uniref:Pyrroline-5-carboxylate reductase n=1 Tax=Egicoccus halophilus TaxID=1670830 RepID=A0A8J3AGB1_9ACTN|nr:pyrroline-5-carboxylate reductase [Egicoccus halophilus]GGI07628.1 pyrroline-5-carboxylate reductase [Egicoccus halophilus]